MKLRPVVGVMLVVPAILLGGETRIGKYAGEFMAIGVGGRSLGLGSAYVALANDVTAGYWNPAALARLDYPEFSLMHDERYGNLVNYDYGSVAFPFGANVRIDPADGRPSAEGTEMHYGASTVAVSVIRLGVDGIPDTRKAWNDLNGNGLFDDGPDIRPDISRITFFNAADWAVYFSYGTQHSENFYYGGNVKLIRRDIAEFHGTGLGFDLAGLYTPYENLYLGVNIQDVTTTLVAWNTGTNELISPTMRLGGAYLFDFLGGRFAPSLDADLRFEGRKYAAMAHLGPVSADLHGGLEYDFKRIVAIRAGYNDIGHLTLGAGIHLRKLDIDYSFSEFSGSGELGNTHRISLRLVIEEERYRRGAE